jgi:hypothetical protein
MLCAEDKIKKTELLEAENRKLQAENNRLKERQKRWEAGAADRRWKALGGSW